MPTFCLRFSDHQPLEPLAEALMRLSPDIAIRKDEAIFIDSRRCEKLYQQSKSEALLLRIKALCKRFDRQVHIGQANTAAMALVYSRLPQQCAIQQLPLETFYDLVNPFRPLRQQPIIQMGIERMLPLLHKLGIHHLEAFSQLPTQKLGNRFGKLATIIQQRLRAESIKRQHMHYEEGWQTFKPQENICLREQTSQPTVDLEPLLFEFKKLIDQTTARLRGRGEALTCLSCRFNIWKKTA